MAKTVTSVFGGHILTAIQSRGRPCCMVDNCITEREDTQGYWWCYHHSPGEPAETLEMAIRIAGEVAATEARKRGKTYIVASTSPPAPSVYVFACDHPDAAKVGVNVMFEFTPAGDRIRHKPTRH